MSACNNFTPRAVGVGPRDDVCLNCPSPEEAHPAPLSPIALDFNIPEKRYGIEFMDANDYDPNKKTAPGMQPVWLAAYDQAILAQHLAIVARVAQEEREKCVKELLDLVGRKIRQDGWYEGVRESAHQLALKLPEELANTLLRGTP